MDEVAVPSLLVALQVYSPESSGYTDKISSAAKPKSYVVLKRWPGKFNIFMLDLHVIKHQHNDW